MTIELKNRKSWLLIVLFTVPTLQLLFVISLIFLNFKTIPIVQFIVMLGIYFVFLYFLVKGLLWQLRGVRQLSVSENKLTYKKYSPVTNKSKTYDLDKIRRFDILDSTVKEGPLAMLQLLGIADRLFLTFDYEGKTVKTISGNSLNELQPIKDKINGKLR